MLAVKRRNTAVSKKLPRETLRDLRTRAGLSAAEVARALGYKSTGGYHAYEIEKQRDKLIPYDVIKRLIPLFVGRGTPPVRNEELIAISEAATWTDNLPTAKASGPVVINTPLAIRFRVERGAFMDDLARAGKKYGTSSLLASPHFEPASQWVAQDADADKLCILHCVDLEQVPSHRRLGMRCIAKVERNGSGLYEIVVSTFKADGTAENGTAVGVVIASYKAE